MKFLFVLYARLVAGACSSQRETELVDFRPRNIGSLGRGGITVGPTRRTAMHLMRVHLTYDSGAAGAVDAQPGAIFPLLTLRTNVRHSAGPKVSLAPS